MTNPKITSLLASPDNRSLFDRHSLERVSRPSHGVSTVAPLSCVGPPLRRTEMKAVPRSTGPELVDGIAIRAELEWRTEARRTIPKWRLGDRSERRRTGGMAAGRRGGGETVNAAFPLSRR